MLNQLNRSIFRARFNGSIFKSLRNHLRGAGEQIEPEQEGVQHAQDYLHHMACFKPILFKAESTKMIDRTVTINLL